MTKFENHMITFIIEVLAGSVNCFNVARQKVFLALSRNHFLIDTMPEPVLCPKERNIW